MTQSSEIIQMIEEVFEPIDKILLMEQLSGHSILGNYDRNNIENAKSSLKAIIKRHYENVVNNIRMEVNKEVDKRLNIKYRNDLIKNLFHIKAVTNQISIILGNQEIVKIMDFNTKTLQGLQDQIPNFIDESYNLINKIKNNREIFIECLNEIVNELKQQIFIVDPELISMTSHIVMSHCGVEEFHIKYQNYSIKTVVDYTVDMIDTEMFKEKLRHDIFDNFNRKIIKGNSEELQKSIDNICKAYSFKSTRFMDCRDESEKPYDLQEGYINKNFKITQFNRTQFTKDLIGAITTIGFVKTQGLFLNGQNIKAGTKYYCKFVKEEKIDDDTYTVYDIRNGEKPLLEIYKNGIMLKGRQRIKMLKHFNYR